MYINGKAVIKSGDIKSKNKNFTNTKDLFQ